MIHSYGHAMAVIDGISRPVAVSSLSTETYYYYYYYNYFT
jgi:hypothetical protein